MKGINRRSLLGAGAGLLLHKRDHAHAAPLAPGTPNTTAGSCSLVVETAKRFLAALGPDQRAKATFKFEDEERMNWHFIPKERKGLSLREMTPYQKHLASALLSAGLSQTGYVKAVTIMSLEDVLRIIENASDEYGMARLSVESSGSGITHSTMPFSASQDLTYKGRQHPAL
jgi:hypothetical protein